MSDILKSSRAFKPAFYVSQKYIVSKPSVHITYKIFKMEVANIGEKCNRMTSDDTALKTLTHINDNVLTRIDTVKENDKAGLFLDSK